MTKILTVLHHHKRFFMLAEANSTGISTLLLVYSFLLCYFLKTILIDDSDVTGFQGYRASQLRLIPVGYPIITLLHCMNAITKEYKLKSCYFILE